jgi:hydrogenase/urease accessory protein HupE
VKNNRLVVAASFALLLAVGVPSAHASGTDEPWAGPAEFVQCLIEGVQNLLS